MLVKNRNWFFTIKEKLLQNQDQAFELILTIRQGSLVVRMTDCNITGPGSILDKVVNVFASIAKESMFFARTL